MLGRAGGVRNRSQSWSNSARAASNAQVSLQGAVSVAVQSELPAKERTLVVDLRCVDLRC